MYEICGGPHLTVTIKCPQYEASSAYYYANPYVQPQSYFSPGYSSYQYEEPYHQPQQQNSEVYEQEQLDRIMGMLVQLVATDETTQRMIQEHEVLFQNHQSILSDIRCSVEEISRRLEEVEETENKGIIDFGCEEEEITMQVASCGIVRESNSDMKESQEEPETIMVDSDPPLVLHEEKEEKEERVEEQKKPVYGYTYDEEGNYLGYTIKTGELITSFPEPGKELYTDDVEDEEQNIPEPETTMDAEVPPPNPKDTEADFWSDSEDDEAEAEAWAAYQREFLQRKKIVEEEKEEVDMAEAGWLFNDNVEEKEPEEIDADVVELMKEEEIERCVPSLEEEFGEELVDIPTLVDEELVDIPKTEESEEDEFLDLDIGSLGGCEGVDAFDSTIDMDYFDALLVEELEEIVEPTLIEELKYGDLDEDVVVDEEYHSWPVAVTEDKSHGSPRLQKKKKRLKFRGIYSPHGTPRTVFDPGKFAYTHSDPSEHFEVFIQSKNKFLLNKKDRIELNGLDRVQVKEKPP